MWRDRHRNFESHRRAAAAAIFLLFLRMLALIRPCGYAQGQEFATDHPVAAALPRDLEPAFQEAPLSEAPVSPNIAITPEGGIELAPGSETSSRDDLIETDRNAFTLSPRTVPRNQRIFESTYTYIGVGSAGSKYSFPEGILRIGLTDRLEARIGYNFETGTDKQASEGDIVNGFGIDAEQQAFYGFKYQVTKISETFRYLPESVLFVQGHTPIASVPGQTQIRLGTAWGWELPNGWQLSQSMRFGTDVEDGDHYTLWTPSSVLKIPLTASRRWFTQLEYYSVMSSSREVDFSMQFIDTGLHYLPNPNFEIGAMIGFGLNDQSRGVILNLGFGYKF